MGENNLEINIFKQKKNFLIAYTFIFIGFYALVPLIYVDSNKYDSIPIIVIITLISLIGFIIGLDFYSKKEIFIEKIELNFERFSNFIFIIYIIIILIILFTATNIPIIESINGADQYDLILFREEFLKKREGWESYLGYAITLIDTTIFPYIIVNSFRINYKRKFLFLFIFIFYSICFLEKAYFLKIAIPLFFYFYFISKNKKTFLLWGGLVVFSLISIMFMLTKFDSTEFKRDEPFFSILYTPSSITSAIVWRSTAVPVITAIEGLDLFAKDFNSELFYGSTSSFISFLFGFERSNFERILYFNQFGGEGTGNANQCYLIEAFINFGYLGVFLFSYLIGRFIKGIVASRDIAALCIVPLFFYNLFNAGLIGLLLGNGYLFFFLFIKFFKFKL